MDFELGAEGQEAERVAAWLEAGGEAFADLCGLDIAALRRVLLAVQGALAGRGRTVAARLALARRSSPLFLALEATRHLQDLVGSLGAGGLPEADSAAMARGERIGAVALADSADAPPARLVRRGDGWRLTARKSFVTNAPAADWIAVFADSDGREAVGLVSPTDAGMRVGERMELMGLDGLPVAGLSFEETPLPASRVLGPFGERVASARYARDADLSLALAAAGLMREVLRATHRHARDHRRGGRPVFSRQEVAFKLADVLALTEAAELLCHRASWMTETADHQADTVVRCAKVFCTESAERAASACLQVMGGEGYRKGNVAERAYRDAKGLALAGTTVEVARMAIADALLSPA